MKVCNKCGKEFPFLVKIDGITRNLSARRFCIGCSPFGKLNRTNLTSPSPIATIDKLSNEEFKNLINISSSRSDALFKLKLRKSGASFLILNRRLKNDNVDISHFKMGCGNGNNRKYSNEEVYCINSTFKIKYRVIADKIMEYRCKQCKNDGTWLDEKLTLELDHINGDRYDNRIENLRWLCPNCHSQTSTFGNKRRT